MRSLGDALEPIREGLIADELKGDKLDTDLVLYTAYPKEEVTAREVVKELLQRDPKAEHR